jgi:glutathione S-transferase
VCGNEITIADYFGIGLLTLGEVVGSNFAEYPNIRRWLGNMKKLKSWGSVNEALYGLRDAVKDHAFERV